MTMTTRVLIIHHAGATQRIKFFPEGKKCDLEEGIRELFDFPRKSPLRFRDEDGDIVLLSPSGIQCGTQLHVSIEQGIPLSTQSSSLPIKFPTVDLKIANKNDKIRLENGETHLRHHQHRHHHHRHKKEVKKLKRKYKQLKKVISNLKTTRRNKITKRKRNCDYNDDDENDDDVSDDEEEIETKKKKQKLQSSIQRSGNEEREEEEEDNECEEEEEGEEVEENEAERNGGEDEGENEVEGEGGEEGVGDEEEEAKVDKYVPITGVEVFDKNACTLVKNEKSKFYVLQLVEKEDNYYLFTRHGQFGEIGKFECKKFNRKSAAISAFRTKFYQKTNNTWSSACFTSVEGKYELLVDNDDDDNGGDNNDDNNDDNENMTSSLQSPYSASTQPSPTMPLEFPDDDDNDGDDDDNNNDWKKWSDHENGELIGNKYTQTDSQKSSAVYMRNLPRSGKHYFVVRFSEQRPCCVAIGFIPTSLVNIPPTHNIGKYNLMAVQSVGERADRACFSSTTYSKAADIGVYLDIDRKLAAFVIHGEYSEMKTVSMNVEFPATFVICSPKHDYSCELITDIPMPKHKIYTTAITRAHKL